MTIYDWQTVAAGASWIACTVFIVLYDQVKWYSTNTGKNLMAMAGCLWFLASAALVRRLFDIPTGQVLLLIGWTGLFIVIVWRTLQMWRITHPKKAPPPSPVNPSPPKDRSWYSPTPTSILEPPRKGGKHGSNKN